MDVKCGYSEKPYRKTEHGEKNLWLGGLWVCLSDLVAWPQWPQRLECVPSGCDYREMQGQETLGSGVRKQN